MKIVGTPPLRGLLTALNLKLEAESATKLALNDSEKLDKYTKASANGGQSTQATVGAQPTFDLMRAFASKMGGPIFFGLPGDEGEKADDSDDDVSAADPLATMMQNAASMMYGPRPATAKQPKASSSLGGPMAAPGGVAAGSIGPTAVGIPAVPPGIDPQTMMMWMMMQQMARMQGKSGDAENIFGDGHGEDLDGLRTIKAMSRHRLVRERNEINPLTRYPRYEPSREWSPLTRQQSTIDLPKRSTRWAKSNARNITSFGRWSKLRGIAMLIGCC